MSQFPSTPVSLRSYVPSTLASPNPAPSFTSTFQPSMSASRGLFTPEPAQLLPNTGFVRKSIRITPLSLKLISFFDQYDAVLSKWFENEGFERLNLSNIIELIKKYSALNADDLRGLGLTRLNYLGHLLGKLALDNPREFKMLNEIPDTIIDVLTNEIERIKNGTENDSLEYALIDEVENYDDSEGEELVRLSDGTIGWRGQEDDDARRQAILQQIANLEQTIAFLRQQL